MTDATTFVAGLGSRVGTVLQDVSYFIAVITSRLVTVLGAVPAGFRMSNNGRLKPVWVYLAM